jgi:LPXTG-site transpeptidase (sortase) family protein
MRKTLLFIAKRISAILLVSVALYAIWNWPLVSTLSKPHVSSAIATITRATPTPEPTYDPSLSRFYYPRLGIAAPMTESADTSPLRSQDWASIKSALVKGVSLNYSGGSLKDARLAYVTGHSSDSYPHDYSSVFASLGQAKVGDVFTLTGKGEQWKYEVTGKKVINPRDVASFSAQSLIPSDGEGSYVALVTCWPLLTDRERMVVVGKRVDVPQPVGYTGN